MFRSVPRAVLRCIEVVAVLLFTGGAVYAVFTLML